MVKSNKKGFTLVELLAVIVILAVILAIAVPGISGVLKSAKSSAFEDNVKLIIKGIEYKKLEAQATGGPLPATHATNDVKASLGDYGANKNDYATFILKSLDPITVSLTGAANGKFGTCSTTDATLASVSVTGCQ